MLTFVIIYSKNCVSEGIRLAASKKANLYLCFYSQGFSTASSCWINKGYLERWLPPEGWNLKASDFSHNNNKIIIKMLKSK